MTTITSFYAPLALAVGGMLFYHLAQKSIPGGINPFYATMIAYVVGIAVCAVCALVLPGNKSLATSLRQSNWAVFIVGAGAACIEVGFLLAYRYGWRISVTNIVANVAGTLLLVPIGLLVFKEHLSLRNIWGSCFVWWDCSWWSVTNSVQRS